MTALSSGLCTHHQQISCNKNERIPMKGLKGYARNHLLGAMACVSNEDPNQCFMGKNLRYRNAVTEGEIFAYP